LFNSTISHFYPQLIYATYSTLNIVECNFYDSSENPGVFSIRAIILEYNISFVIDSCIFENLANSVAGPVYLIIYFLLELKLFLKAIYLNQLVNVLNNFQYNNTISNCQFRNNTSYQGEGGSIYMFLPGDIKIINSSFINNTAYYGASIYYEEHSTFFFRLIFNLIYYNKRLQNVEFSF